MSRTIFYRLIALATSLFYLRTTAMAQEPYDPARERRIAPLHAAGIDINSVEAVIRALNADNFSVRSAALHLLRDKKEISAVPELRALAGQVSNPPILRADACNALAELDPETASWKTPCKGLLEERYDSIVRIRAGGALAKAGDTGGWSVIRAALFSSQPTQVVEAAIVAPAFDGLEVSLGERIRLGGVCAEAFPKADESSQAALLGLFGKVARADDAGVLANLVDSAKSQYLKDSIRTILKQIAPK